MYSKQLKDTNTITWHNLHFLLEHHCKETLSTIENIIVDQRYESDHRSLEEFKQEVIATVKTIQAMETVVKHHRFTNRLQKGA